VPKFKPNNKSSNKVALITGGGRNIGKAIALSLAEQGFSLVINYNNSSREAHSLAQSLRKKGTLAIAIKANVSKKAEVNRLIKKSLQTFGRIDLLVNNASVFSMSTINTTTEKEWDDTININLKGTFLCSQAVAPIMLKQKNGKIINIASVAGIIGWSKYIPYSISKAGVIMLTKLMAKALAPNILVNAVAPGYIDIPNKSVPSKKKMPLNKILLKRYGSIKDITDIVLYLATKSDYITGQLWAVDGGRSIF
jgi:3-oxoacyl-[acyl-carrier protein] reductase